MEQTLPVESALAEASKVAGALVFLQLGLLVIPNVETVISRHSAKVDGEASQGCLWPGHTSTKGNPDGLSF